jgi:choline dehydrogenase-like flavoprotein
VFPFSVEVSVAGDHVDFALAGLLDSLLPNAAVSELLRPRRWRYPLDNPVQSRSCDFRAFKGHAAFLSAARPRTSIPGRRWATGAGATQRSCLSPPDAELTVRAVRIAHAIMTAPAMTPFQMSELGPGADRTTDDEILDWVKKAAETTYHPVGTCKMGSDPMAVVDAQLRVHGIAGLRVADASIMPTLTSGNTNAPSTSPAFSLGSSTS